MLVSQKVITVTVKKYIYIATISIFMFLSLIVKGQESSGTNIKEAVKSGSSKELALYFNNSLEINIDGEKKDYSKTQAEFVLKDFFKNHPPQDFLYIHQGASKEGLKYTIGKYTWEGGEYRVYMVIKKFGEDYRITTIDFSEE